MKIKRGLLVIILNTFGICSFAFGQWVETPEKNICTGGKVGIGITKPEATLHLNTTRPASDILNPKEIASEIKLSCEQSSFIISLGTSTTTRRAEGTIKVSDPSNTFVLNALSPTMSMIFQTQNSERLRISSGGIRFRPNQYNNMLVSGENDDVYLNLVKNSATTLTTSARIMFDGYSDQSKNEGEIAVFTKQSTDTSLKERMRIKSNGNVGIGTTNPDRSLTIANTAVSNYMNVKDNTREILMGVDDSGGVISVMSKHDLSLRAGGNDEKMRITAGGKIGIGTKNPNSPLGIQAQGDAEDLMSFHDKGGIPRWLINLTQYPNGNNTGLNFVSAELHDDRPFGGPGPYIVRDSKLFIKQDGNVGIGTTNPEAKLHVNGTTQTKVLKITGGSDLSEQFNISSNISYEGFEIEPGTVVGIDPENPGNLIISNKPYDRTVAGIISGAGGIESGMLMGQSGTTADGKIPVALTGRVYCKADATYGKIQPGDLLTTSDIPGHAMRVNDYEKAQGAIIGKAMTSLDEGQGLVLVLVSLQ